MNIAIDTRELITICESQSTIFGTHHKVPAAALVANIGIVFLNGLYAARSANGDAAVFWADSFAERGFPSFRVDLPGYGDSSGDPPDDWLNFINRGFYAPAAAGVVKHLSNRFMIPRFIIIGHCAGATSAIYTAASAGAYCAGLVLLDPYFHLPHEATASFRQSLREWALTSTIGRQLSGLFDLVKEARIRSRANDLPENANVALLRCWKTVASAGLPILILKAPARGSTTAKPRLGEFDYFRYALDAAGTKSRVSITTMEGAHHSFANLTARKGVEQHVEAWLERHFCSMRDAQPSVRRTVPTLS